MKQVKHLLSFTLALLMVLPVFTFAAVPVYATIAQDSVIFEAMSYYGAADAPIVVEESDIDDDRADPVVISSLTLVEKPTKLTYNWGEVINLEGVMLIAKYSDDSSKTIYYDNTELTIENSDIANKTEPDKDVAIQTVDLAYEGKTVTFEITVLNPVTELELVHGPYKTLYRTGQEFVPNGIELKATYEDGSNRTLTSGYSLSGFNSGRQEIGQEIKATYSYDGASESVIFTVDIFAPLSLSTGGAYEMNYKESVAFTPSVPARAYQTGVSYDYWISDTSVADIDAGRIYGLRRGTVNLRVTAVETIEKDGQTLVFEYAERTTIRVKLTFWQWFVKFFILFGWLGFDIYI